MAGLPTDKSIWDNLSEHWQAITFVLVAVLGGLSNRVIKRNDQDNETRDQLIGVLSRKVSRLESQMLLIENAHLNCPHCPKVMHVEEPPTA